MVIRGQSLSIEDSIFSGLDARGLAVISFVNSNVTIRNATFTDGSNSAGRSSLVSGAHEQQAGLLSVLEFFFFCCKDTTCFLQAALPC